MMEIIFRKIKPEDLEMVLEWRTREDISRYMYTDIEKDMTKQIQWYENINRDRTRIDWIVRVDGNDAGVVSITNIDKIHKRCDWAFYLALESARRHGVSNSIAYNIQEYVFERLRFNKLCAEVLEKNALVGKWHQMLGSAREGLRREHILKNGEYHGVLLYGLLREDWIKNIKGKAKYDKAIFE